MTAEWERVPVEKTVDRETALHALLCGLGILSQRNSRVFLLLCAFVVIKSEAMSLLLSGGGLSTSLRFG